VIDARRKHLYVQRFHRSGSELTKKGDASVKELEKIKEDLNENSVIVGTGWNRLDLEEDSGVKTFGSESISATSLITAWNNESLKQHFTKEDPRLFDPDYLEIAQLNNSSM